MLTNEYLKRVYEGLEKRNANEPEFLQAVREVLESIQPVVEKHPEYEKAALLERMGLTRENLMACGDGLNDRSMIAYAGVGVAMQNAEDAVKAVADYVTAADNNHDGVAEAIEKFILN